MSLVSSAASASVPAQPADAPEQLVLLARQPILDAAWTVRGYELLFRQPDGTAGPIDDARRATAHVIVSAFTDVGLDRLAGDCPVWINVSKDFLLTVDPLPLPHDRVVLELLETITPDDELLDRLDVLRAQGYRFALDDFEYREELEPLVECASFIKLDVRALGVDGVALNIQRLAGTGCRVVGEKVETIEERDALLELGVDLFQGYFFERPNLVHGRPAPSSAMERLQTATKLQGDPSFEDVEQMVMMDPGLSVRLLRFVNSAGTGLRSRVSSLRQALVLVGAKTVQQWALLVLLTDIGRARPAVLSAGLIRARLCQSLAKDAGVDVDAMTAVGLLSVVDALLDAPLDEIIGSLPLTTEIQDAIVQHTGPMGELLEQACRLQHGAAAPSLRNAMHVRDAFEWADATLREIGMA
jgi:EAL and modified HD-GYP domain-containing signal transduction protein